MQHSLSKALNIRIGLVILGINVVISLIFFVFLIRMAENDFKNNIELQTKHLSDAFSQQLWLFDLNATQKLSTLALDAEDIRGLRLYDHNKKVIVDAGSFHGKRVVHINNELWYGGQTLVGSIELAFVNVSWKKQRNIIFLTVFSMVGATLVTTFLFIQSLLRQHLAQPLKNLQQDMVSLSDGKFRQSKLRGQKTEIQNIIDVFNKMAVTLAQREQKQLKTERKLRESQQRYLSLFNGSKDSIFTTTKEGVFVDINPAMLTLLGYTENEIDRIVAPNIYENRGIVPIC